MKAEEARHLIALSDDPEEPVAVPASVLSELTIHDLHEGPQCTNSLVLLAPA